VHEKSTRKLCTSQLLEYTGYFKVPSPHSVHFSSAEHSEAKRAADGRQQTTPSLRQSIGKASIGL